MTGRRFDAAARDIGEHRRLSLDDAAESLCRVTGCEVRVPHGFYAGSGTKVHLGYERRGDVVKLMCGMAGRAFGEGRKWLIPTDAPVNCGSCLRSSKA